MSFCMKKIGYYFVAMCGTLILAFLFWIVCALLYQTGFSMYSSYGDDTKWAIGGAMAATAFLLYLFRYGMGTETSVSANEYQKAFYATLKSVANAVLIGLVLFIMCCSSA